MFFRYLKELLFTLKKRTRNPEIVNPRVLGPGNGL